MKKIVIVVVVAFLAFWMFTDPDGLAGTAQTAGAEAWTLTQQLFGAVIDFVGALD